MASSIIGGLLESGHPAQSISAADPFPASLERLREMAPIRVCADNPSAVADADVIIMAVKPQVMAEATDSIAAAVKANAALVISIAAGVTMDAMAARLGAAAGLRCQRPVCQQQGQRAATRTRPVHYGSGRHYLLGQLRTGTGRHYRPVGKRTSLFFPVHGGDDRRRVPAGTGPRYRHHTGRADRAGEQFERDGLRQLVNNAMEAAAKRAAEMAREMG